MRKALLCLALAGIGLGPSSFAAGAPTLIPGFLKFEAYTNITTTPVQALLDDPSYPNSPGETLYMTSFDTRTVYPTDAHENFGARVTGFVTPTVSGDYEFFLRSDDAGHFYISPDDNFANLELVAEEAGCCGAFEETGALETSPARTLVAGRRYAVQMLYKEATGGDYGQIAWRRAGDATPANLLTPIPAAYLSSMIPADGTITITQQPANKTAAQNDMLTLSLAATSTLSPLLVQWQKNGVLMPGVTGQSVTIGPLAASDANAKFRAVLSIPGATITSDEITLTLTPDVTVPKITSASGSDTFTSVTVNFSEAVTSSTADKPGNYTLSGGLTVSAATVVSPTRVVLTTSMQTPGTSYTLTINGVQDTATAPNTMSGATFTFPAFTNVRGGLKFDAFYDIPGSAVQAFLDDAKYIENRPDFSAYVTQFSSRQVFTDSSHENYGGRIAGWIIPAQAGEYEFFLRSDDASQLYLSPDENPANAVVIAEETGCCGPFEEPGAPETSAPQNLQANKRYYIMALWKEGGGGDYLDLAWRRVGDTTSPRSLPYIPGTVLESVAPPGVFDAPTISLTSPAAGDSFEVGAPVTLDATAAGVSGKTVAKVEFFEQGRLIAAVTTAPYSITLTNLSEDAHAIVARVTDSAGISAETAPRSFSVGGLQKKLTLLAIDANTVWRYDRSGRDLSGQFQQKNYDDSAWPQGKALIADETTTTVEPIRTAISRLTDDGTYIKTFYFRGKFNFPGPITPGTKLQLRHVVDDGAVFYLNGTEILRFGIAADVTVDATTDASGHENAYEGPIDIPLAALVAGENVLAVEVHQSGGSSSDMVFGAELTASVPAVTQTFVAINDTTNWRYDRTGRDLTGQFQQRNYDDSAWPQGKALIADETTTTVEPIRTAISRLTDDGTYIKTFYFRTKFNFAGEIATAKLKLRHVVDDGAILYLNGTEINRLGIAADVVVDATTDASGHENAYEGPFDIPASLLVQGENVLAAEVHQSGGSSSDMVFGAELIGTYFPSSGDEIIVPSRLSVARQGAQLEINWTESGTLQETGSLQPPINWAPVAGNPKPHRVTPSGAPKFFRVVR